MYSCSHRDPAHVRPTSRATFPSIACRIFLPLSAAAALAPWLHSACPGAKEPRQRPREKMLPRMEAQNLGRRHLSRLLFLEQIEATRQGPEPDALNVVERTELTGEVHGSTGRKRYDPDHGSAKSLQGASYLAAQRSYRQRTSLFSARRRASA